MSDVEKTVFEDIVDRAEIHAQSLGMLLNPKLKIEIRKLAEEVMNEENKQFVKNPAVNEILTEMSELRDKALDAIENASRNRDMQWADLPPYCMPNLSKSDVVEVAPGVMVSQHLIDEAVRHTSHSGEDEESEEYSEEIEKEQIAKQKQFEELKQDLSTSKQIVQAMMDRARQPVNTHEKFVSYDAMPSPLQRVVKAYIDAAAANAELDAAVKALNLAPMVVAASEVKAD